MKTLLDKDNFYFAPYAILKALLMSQSGKEPTFEEITNAAKKIAGEPTYEKFYDFAIDSLDKLGSNNNILLMMFHLQRFFQMGATTYKIRKEKVEFLQNIELNIPANLLILPFDEFMISVPKGSITTSQGDLLNVYVCQEPFDPEIYKDGRYEVEENIAELIKNNPGKIKRLIRCYGISWKEGNDDAETTYYQMPVIEDRDIWEQFLHLVNTTQAYEHKDTIKQIFNLMLNFCAYLSCPNPDIEKILGVIRKPIQIGSKKWRQAEKSNLVSGYGYFDVGKVYATRYHSDIISYQETGIYVRKFKVRRHIRAQWYGSKADGKPGTEQKLIMIEDHWKGGGLKDAFKPKMMEVS